jgi:hypothetical protein
MAQELGHDAVREVCFIRFQPCTRTIRDLASTNLIRSRLSVELITFGRVRNGEL